MKHLANLLLVVGFCVGTLGASGFAQEIESGAVAIFAAGLVLLVVGGLLGKQAARAEAVDSGTSRAHLDIGDFGEGLGRVAETLRELDETTPDPDGLRQRLDDLISGELEALTSRNDEMIRKLGFSDYSRLWEGLATAERLLARAWSLCTDGHPDDAREEVRLARRHLGRSEETLAHLRGS